MKKEHKLVCIACPNGCRLTVTESEKNIEVNGNKCPRGEEYGRNEILNPKRIVTAVVKTDSDKIPYLPVKTDAPLPKELVYDLLREIYKAKTSTPIKRGTIIIKNFKNTGVNVVNTRSA